MQYKRNILYILLYIFTISITVLSFTAKPHPINNEVLVIVRYIIVFFASVLLSKYTFYMLLCPLYQLVNLKEKELLHIFVKEYKPLVSVMIPAWNERVGIVSTIKTLLKSSYRNVEIVIVNDGSTDDSDALIQSFIKKYEREFANEKEKIRIIYQYQKNGGKGAALNAAISLSHGELLISIDADCIVTEKAIENFVSVFRDPRTMCAVGNVKIWSSNAIISTIERLEYRMGFFFKQADSVLGTIYIAGGAAACFRRSVFEKLGVYSLKNITEDIELSMRIQDAGMKIVYCPNAIIYTGGASTLKGLMKQRLRWKRGREQTFSQYRHMFFSLRPQHNKWLTWLILPLAFFGDIQLSLEPLFLFILYIFSFMNNDFTAFMSGVFVVSFMFIIQTHDSKEDQNVMYLLLSPIGWALFYLTTYVECYALFKSIILMINKQDLKWQKWDRRGVIER